MSEAKLDVVLFLAGSLEGISAKTIELLSDEGGFLEYRVTFPKPGYQAQPAPGGPIQDPDGFQYDQVISVEEAAPQAVVIPEPDTSPTPDWVDDGVVGDGDDQLPDLPDVS